MVNLFVARRMPAGPIAFGAFLVDLWPRGLKDCWGNIGITSKEFQAMLRDAPAFHGVTFIPVDEELAAEIVHGGIRWARKHGFPLPEGTRQWTAILAEPTGGARLDRFGNEIGEPIFVERLYPEELEDVLGFLESDEADDFEEDEFGESGDPARAEPLLAAPVPLNADGAPVGGHEQAVFADLYEEGLRLARALGIPDKEPMAFCTVRFRMSDPLAVVRRLAEVEDIEDLGDEDGVRHFDWVRPHPRHGFLAHLLVRAAAPPMQRLGGIAMEGNHLEFQTHTRGRATELWTKLRRLLPGLAFEDVHVRDPLEELQGSTEAQRTGS